MSASGRGGRRRRVVAAIGGIAGIAVVAAALTTGVFGSTTGVLGGTAAAAVAPLHPGSVRVQVVHVLPSTPVATRKPAALTVELRLTNTTAATMRHVTITGVRGEPIGNEKALNAQMAGHGAPSGGVHGVPLRTAGPVAATVAAHQSTTVRFTTSTSTIDGAAGLCLCQNRIYPLYFQAEYAPDGGARAVVGTARTFVPSFGTAPVHRMLVGWVWPLLERPHRGTSSTVFTDDSLANSVAGGRLDRLLSTLELVTNRDPAIGMTVLLDPELVDALAVMASGKYKLRMADGSTVPGTAAASAASWLQRLRTVLRSDPKLQLALTAYADPDVRSLTASGLSWSQNPDPVSRARVREALGGSDDSTDISWPVGGSIDARTLRALVRRGVHTVIVNGATVPGSVRRHPTPDALAPKHTRAGPATLAITSAQIQHYAARAVSGQDAGSALARLSAQVALRVEHSDTRSHYVLITPPRGVDPDPEAASQAILDTADAYWSHGVSLGTAVDKFRAVKQGRLRPHARPHPLAASTIAAARYVTDKLPTLRSMLTPPLGQRGGNAANGGSAQTPDPKRLLIGLSTAVQRSESSEWGADDSGAQLASAVRARTHKLIEGVHVIRPTQGTYTFGSSHSKLPITIDNSLRLPVWIHPDVHTTGGLPGFAARDVGVKEVLAHSKVAIRVPAHVVRAGRFTVHVGLRAPDGAPLGTAVQLSVRSTALGTLGEVITVVAATVLGLALLVRLLRQWRRRRNRAPAQRA